MCSQEFFFTDENVRRLILLSVIDEIFFKLFFYLAFRTSVESGPGILRHF